MLALIKKDFLIQKKTLRILLIVLAFLAFTLSGFGPGGFVTSIMCACYLLVFGASAHEDKSHSDVLLNSLPIRKSMIVFSKYVSVYVFAAFGIMVNVILTLLAELFRIDNYGYSITADGMLAAFMAVTVMFSLAFPIIFRFGYMKAKIVNYVLFLAVFIAVQFADEMLPQVFEQLSEPGNAGLALLASAILLAASCFISLHVYNKREFA